MDLKEAIRQVDATIAEKQRMATLEVVALMRLKIEKGMASQDAAGEALEEIWARRGLDTPESGWDPGGEPSKDWVYGTRERLPEYQQGLNDG